MCRGLFCLLLVSHIEKLKAEVEELKMAEEKLRIARQEKEAELRLLFSQEFISSQG